ncbi:WD repeat-containing protein 27, partial [Corchorus olitorius]
DGYRTAFARKLRTREGWAAPQRAVQANKEVYGNDQLLRSAGTVLRAFRQRHRARARPAGRPQASVDGRRVHLPLPGKRPRARLRGWRRPLRASARAGDSARQRVLPEGDPGRIAGIHSRHVPRARGHGDSGDEVHSHRLAPQHAHRAGGQAPVRYAVLLQLHARHVAGRARHGRAARFRRSSWGFIFERGKPGA